MTNHTELKWNHCKPSDFFTQKVKHHLVTKKDKAKSLRNSTRILSTKKNINLLSDETPN